MKPSLTLLVLLRSSLTTVLAAPSSGWGPWGHHGHHRPGQHRPDFHTWDLKKLSSLVVFGDSYSDDSRLGYFIANNGSAPPVGYANPVNYAASSGGRIWGQYVKQYISKPLDKIPRNPINFYNYAVSGAACSNEITPRIFSATGELFPSVREYEVPAFFADKAYVKPNGEKFLNLPEEETVYAMWDGTNDLGAYAFIQDEEVKGTNLTTYVDCIYNQLHRLYNNGARYFVLFNLPPLELVPEYAAPPNDVGVNQYWLTKPENHTEISGRMMEQVVTVNAIYQYRTPFEVIIEREWPGARFANFDVDALLREIYYNPAEYLNGTAPLNVTGFIHQCNSTGGDCTTASSPDSYMWYDELHPSEQTDRVIAREFVKVVEGESEYATYWSS